MKSRLFDSLQTRYNLGWVRIDQLRRYTELEAITPEEYEEICGQEYIK